MLRGVLFEGGLLDDIIKLLNTMTKQLKTYLDLINQNFEELKSHFGVKKIAIFGSIARGESTKRSDIDIIVELNKSVGFFAFIKLEEYLQQILGKKVDLATKESLKPAIKKTVLKEAIYA